MNQGGGSFSKELDFPGDNTWSIAVIDVNGDGAIDIIVGGWRDYTPNQVFLNQGNGSFSGGIILPGGETDTTSIAVADINGDGAIDIIVGNEWKQKNQVILNQGNGSFKYATDLPGGELDTWSIVVADINGDGAIDIIVGNLDGENQALLNKGDGSFSDVTTLPGGNMKTRSIAVADINSDGTIDIIVGNNDGYNQVLLNNGNGSFGEVIDLPGGKMDTNSLAVADITGDGRIDIIVGNMLQNNQVLLNQGPGLSGETIDMFIVDLVGSDMTTHAAVADIDGDGILEVVFGNQGSSSHLIHYLPCPGGGAKLHRASWCFDCPSFMGQPNSLYGFQQRSICKECLPDHVQGRFDGNVQLCTQCIIGEERKLGGNMCIPCGDGTYYDSLLARKESNSSSWVEERCKSCPTGEYSNSDLTAIDGCFKCPPGNFQPNQGSASCDVCKEGQFQTKPGQPSCEKCAKGGYCNATSIHGGGYVACPPGTYNDKFGKSSQASCLECPLGTYSIVTGANSSISCISCPKGTFGNETGQTECRSCQIGTFQNSTKQTTCIKCAPGSYADKPGLVECIQCPHRLDSIEGSNFCHLCSKGFFFNDPFASEAANIFENPSQNCLKCPMLSTKTCPLKNTTLQTLKVPHGYWRASLNTSTIYKCQNKEICIPRADLVSLHEYKTGIYCAEGHTGPLCEVCVNQRDFYFSHVERRCLECPSWSRIAGIQSGIFIIVCLFFYGIYTLAPKRISSVKVFMSSLNLQAKFKVFISFYQVVSSLDVVYGVRISSELRKWVEFFQYFRLDFFDLIGMPKGCIGSMTQQLIFSATWPYVVIFLGMFVIFSHAAVKRVGTTMYSSRTPYLQVGQQNDISAADHGTSCSKTFIQGNMHNYAYVSIVILYFALPTVSRDIFDAIKCRALKTTDYGDPPFYKSYLLVDMKIECNVNNGDVEYRRMQPIFWFFFVLWPVLTPLGFLTLLTLARKSIRTNSITSLADACRFLWNDYDQSVWFWDVIDLWRKIFLSGCIMFIDKEEGSAKLFRLVIAAVVSGMYLGFLTVSRPYKQKDDFYLAFVSNLLLLCSFIFGIILQLCEQDDGTCNKFIGLSLNSFRASAIIVAIVVGMFIITIVFLVILTLNAIQQPTVLLASGRSPNLEMSEDCNYHAFMSHVWSSGQAKTHAIMRNLLLHLPKLKIWLDVNDLEDITKLEEYIAKAEVVVLFYSDGYFRSRNCRREIYTAAQLEKPIIVLFEGNDSVIEAMCAECNEHCGVEPESPEPSFILQYIFKSFSSISDDYVPPILWLDQSAFRAAALNRIYLRLLAHLPYYQKNAQELNNGIVVPGELSPVKLKCKVNILVCTGSNNGSEDLAKEIQSSLSNKEASLINIIDAEEFFGRHDSENHGGEQILSEEDDLLKVEDPVITVLLLYLNEKFFVGPDESALRDLVQSSIEDPNISIILAHEQDVAKGACPFSLFFQQVPQDLIDPPNQLFKDTAIPLYAIEEYRAISFRQILNQFGIIASKSKGKNPRRRLWF